MWLHHIVVKHLPIFSFFYLNVIQYEQKQCLIIQKKKTKLYKYVCILYLYVYTALDDFSSLYWKIFYLFYLSLTDKVQSLSYFSFYIFTVIILIHNCKSANESHNNWMANTTQMSIQFKGLQNTCDLLCTYSIALTYAIGREQCRCLLTNNVQLFCFTLPNKSIKRTSCLLILLLAFHFTIRLSIVLFAIFSMSFNTV